MRLSFDQLLGLPGLHHVIDNATKGLADVMRSYSDNVYLAQQVCRLLRKRDTQPKLLQRCFSRGLGPQFAKDIQAFRGWINPGRWDTVAFSVPELLKVKHALVTQWDEDVFLGGNADQDEGRRRSTLDLAQDVSKAVHDPAWWAWLSMLEVLCGLLREHTVWAESCPCHYDILHSHGQHLSKELKAQFKCCPMRGRRAAELAAGEFLELLGRLWAVTSVNLLRVLPANTNQGQRCSILQEFDHARTHPGFYFAMKVSHLQEMPWKIFK